MGRIEAEEFKYLIAQQKSVYVISFINKFDELATSKIQECHEKLQASGCQYLILNLRDVTEIERIFHRHLIQLQHAIRSVKGQAVRLGGIRPAWQASLESAT